MTDHLLVLFVLFFSSNSLGHHLHELRKAILNFCNFIILLVYWFAGNGWYVYIEASWPRKVNDTARLISSSMPATTATKGKCLSFWYHMYGADINTLSVYVRTGAHDTMLWSKTGTRGDKWLQALVTWLHPNQMPEMSMGLLLFPVSYDIELPLYDHQTQHLATWPWPPHRIVKGSSCADHSGKLLVSYVWTSHRAT